MASISASRRAASSLLAPLLGEAGHLLLEWFAVVRLRLCADVAAGREHVVVFGSLMGTTMPFVVLLQPLLVTCRFTFREGVEHWSAGGLEVADVSGDDGESVFQRRGGDEQVGALVPEDCREAAPALRR